MDTQPWQTTFENWLRTSYKKVSPVKRHPAQTTVTAALQHIRVFVRWHEDTFAQTFEPVHITNYSLRQFQAYSQDEEQVAPATWNARFWALGIFCQWIQITHGKAFADLMDGIQQQNTNNQVSKHRALTPLEIRRLMEVMERDVRGARPTQHFGLTEAIRNQAIITLALHTGLRLSELAALQWADLTLERKTGIVRVRHGKGDKYRAIPLNDTAVRAVRAWQEHSELHGNTATNVWMGKGTGELTTRSIQRLVADTCADAGISGVTPHWLRYTFAKSLQRANVPLTDIARLLGHSNIQTTTIYLASGSDELQAIVDLIG